MRALVALVCALAVAGTAAAGLDLPPRADANSPIWLGPKTVGFEYAQASWNHTPHAANDDGTAFSSVASLPDTTVSPDGRHRYSLDEKSGAVLVDGRVVANGPLHSGLSTVAWSPDSTRLAFATDDGVWVVWTDGTRLHRVHAGAAVTWLSELEVAVGLDGRAAPIYAVHSDGTRARLLATGYDSTSGLAASPDGSELAFGSFTGWGYDRGDALYVASTQKTDYLVHRVSPDVCTVFTTLTTMRGRCVDGTDWNDNLVGTRSGDFFVAGDGDDVIHAGDGMNVVQAQWGSDTILSGSGIDTIDAGGGNDVIRSGGGEDFIDPGPGRDVVFAGRGADHIVANDGERDVIDCGPGDDRVRADVRDVTRSCEHVTR